MGPMLPTIVDLKATQGDSFAQAFRLSENGTPVDLTDSTIAAELRDRDGAVIPLTATPDPALPGVFVLGYGGDVPTYGPHRYDVEVTDADSVVRTWITGRFDVARDVTNALA